MEQGLKLIAIKPLLHCAPKFLRVLNPGEVYYLYQGYKISPHTKTQEKITLPQTTVPAIFDIGHIKVELSAIVGKNGSGKSSLVELFYAILYNIAHRLDFIEEQDEEGEPYLKEPDVFADIYYQLNGTHYRMRSVGSQLLLNEFNSNGIGFKKSRGIRNLSQLNALFYSIVINYSQYSLNSRDLGHWVKAIFHKNDAYQTPIVLNPFRKEGNIDINTESYLVRSRLLANIMEGKDYALWFNSEQKIPERLIFELDEDKLVYKPEEEKRKELLVHYETYWPDTDRAIIDHFFSGKKIELGNGELEEFAKKYILLKLESISRKYKPYWRFRDFMNPESDQLSPFIAKLKGDLSHVAYKIKQAIHFLYLTTLPKLKKEFARSVSGLIQRIKAAREKEAGLPIIELIPPSFFKVDIEFHNKHDRFNLLSSGEKQKIYALSSLIYHLKNLNSVEVETTKIPRAEKLVKYQNINIIFDEVELYYHPELQRRFIKDMFDNIRAAKLNDIKAINFLFVTHSPFILSDIPNDHILYLKAKQYKTEQLAQVAETFGGNIHDLLANSFFLDENGFMGEYARQVITAAFYYLSPDDKKPQKIPELTIEWDEPKVRSVIDMIGEPLIKRSLNELFTDKFLPTVSEIDREIRRLQELKAAKQKPQQP
jgi:AAA15 family ATPase/GTPase